MTHFAWILVLVVNGQTTYSEPTIAEACILGMHYNYDTGKKDTYCINKYDGMRMNPVPKPKVYPKY